MIYPALDLRGRLPSRKELAHHFPIPQDLIHWFFWHYFGLAWPIADPRAIPSLYKDYSACRSSTSARKAPSMAL